MRSPGRSIEPVAVRRRGLWGVLIIVALVFGVVAMHSMSGSPMSHAPASALASMVQMEPEPSAPGAGHETMRADAALMGIHVSPAGADGMHQLMTAMCLMVLVALVVLALPLRPGVKWLTLVPPPGRPVEGGWARSTLRGSPPSLIALGISRT